MITGKQGEDEAVSYLLKRNYEILERNWRSHRMEVDIIARDGSMLVIVEVKTRTSTKFGFPDETVTKSKQKLLAIAASDYLYEKKLDSECRFDIIAVTRKADQSWLVEHFEDAFFPID